VGCWEGFVLDAPRGDGGFGYDPVFLDPATGLSAAQMTAAVKNRVSHRAQAVRALVSALSCAGQANVPNAPSGDDRP
jgi:XTP/dITP diphosphohydrolase